MQNKIFILVSIIFLLFSCNNKSKKFESYFKVGESPILEIEMDDYKKKKYLLSEIIDTLIYIPIVNQSNNYIIVNANKIKFCNDLYFIFDDISSKISVLNTDGITLNIISANSKGKNPVYDIEDFELDCKNMTIQIYERTRKIIHKIDFLTNRIKGYIQLDHYFIEFKAHNDRFYVFADDNSFPLNDIKRAQFKIFSSDFKNQVAGLFQYIPGRDDFDTPQRFYKDNDKLYFTYLMNDTIYEIDNINLIPRIFIDFGQEKVSKDIKFETDQRIKTNKFFEEKPSSFKHYLINNDSILSFWYRTGLNQNYFFLNKITDQVLNSESIIDDLNGGDFPFPYTLHSSGYFISIISSEEIISEKNLKSKKTNLNKVYADDIFNYLVLYKFK